MIDARPRCTAATTGGTPCHAAPLADRAFCLMHDPEHQEAVQQARDNGRARRWRNEFVSQALDLPEEHGLAWMDDILVDQAFALLTRDPPATVLDFTRLFKTRLAIMSRQDLAERMATLEQAVSGVPLPTPEPTREPGPEAMP